MIPVAIYHDHPQFRHSYDWRGYYERAARHGDRVIVWSEHTKRDLLERIGGDPAKVRVVRLAAGADYRRIDDPAAVARCRDQHGLAGAPFVLSVATLEERKNLVTLLRAFAKMVASDPALPHRLVLVGGKQHGAEELFEEAARLGVAGRVRWLGFVADLPLLYNAADAFVFPSLYEGFGLPVLEAMACGVPTLAADATSLPEVVGRADHLFPPLDADVLAAKLHRLLTDRAYHADFAAAGLARAAEFSWAKTAAGYLEVFREALHSRRGAVPP